MVEGKRVFITGGAGFIGSMLTSRLIERNEVTVFDNFSRDALTPKGLVGHPQLRIIKGDILDREHVLSSLRDVDLVVHCAGIAGIDTVIRQPVSTMTVNVIGAAHVLEAASRLQHCERVVCFSTSEVFGTHGFQSSEEHSASVGAVGEARWTYAASKLAQEHLAHAYFLQEGLPTTTVRPFNVYGPGQVGEGAIHGFVRRALLGEPLEVHGDGTQIRAWCYVDDFVDAIELTLHNPAAVGQSFNIGNQRAVVTIYGLANTIVRVLNSTSAIRFVDKDYVDVEMRIPSVAKAREIIGFEARVDLEEGIARTADYYRTIVSN